MFSISLAVLCLAVIRISNSAPLTAEIRLWGKSLKNINWHPKTSRYILGVNFYTGLPALKNQNTLKQLENELGVNTVSFAGTASSLLLPKGYNAQKQCCSTTTQLRKWIASGKACQQFAQGYIPGIWSDAFFRYQTKITPFIMIRDVCSKNNYPTTSHCFGPTDGHSAGVPRNDDGWWTALLTQYVTCTLQTRPDLEWFHLWNEPNAFFSKYGKDGKYFAQFYQQVALNIKKKHPKVRLGGAVTWNYPAYKDDWETWWVPLMEKTLPPASPVQTLDFFDWHTYNHAADAMHAQWDVAVATSEVLSLYSWHRFGKKLKSSITETNHVLNKSFDAWNAYHWKTRTINNAQQAIALSHIPDKFDMRMIFDAAVPDYSFLNSIDYQGNKILKYVQDGLMVDFEVLKTPRTVANRKGLFYDQNIMSQIVYNPSANQFYTVLCNGATQSVLVHLKDMDGMVKFLRKGKVAKMSGNNAVFVDINYGTNGPGSEAWITLPPKSLAFMPAGHNAQGKPAKTLRSYQYKPNNINCYMRLDNWKWPGGYSFTCSIPIQRSGTVRRAYMKMEAFWGAVGEYKWSIMGTFNNKKVVNVVDYLAVLQHNEFSLPAADMQAKGTLVLAISTKPVKSGWLWQSRFGAISAVVDYV